MSRRIYGIAFPTVSSAFPDWCEAWTEPYRNEYKLVDSRDGCVIAWFDYESIRHLDSLHSLSHFIEKTLTEYSLARGIWKHGGIIWS